jgi:DNA-binding FadR family transcriptional regulator
MSRPDAIRIPKAGELVAEELRRRIVTGELQPGDQLPTEGQLVEQFQVAQTSVREALRILESEGLVSVRRGAPGGGLVREADPRTLARYASLLLQFEGVTVEDVHLARILIEPLTARRLAEGPDRAELAAALAGAFRDEDASSARPEELARMEGRFHQLVTRLAGNETLALLSAVGNLIVAHHVNRVLARGRRGNGRARPGFVTAHRAHGRLVELVASGDADGVEQLWRRHLEEALTNLGSLGQTTVADLMG